MNDSCWHFAILIPARDEEKLLPRCLSSVNAARERLPLVITSDVIVVSDSSTDKTREIAQRLLGKTGVVVSTNVGRVGAARRLAAEVALKRYRGRHEYCWLANTDADCEVPISWLLDQLKIAAQGFAAVAGTIRVDSFVEHDARVEELFRQTYLTRADGTHPHVHGANFGVRADAYLRVGGWLDLATAEDHDLWNRLQHSGHQRLSDAHLQVVTSGRRLGRAPFGFADALAAHNEAAA